MSFSLRAPRPGTNAYKTTIGEVNKTGILMAYNDVGSHVVVPIDGGTLKKWHDDKEGSKYTQELRKVCVN